MQTSKLSGVFTALATPFKNGKVDHSSLSRLIEFQMGQGIDGFVINGTTGESPTLKSDEVAEIFRFVKEKTGGQKTLIVGTGTNSTESTIQNAKAARDLGADAQLVVVPYYNKPPQAGLIKHFEAVAEATELPIILYNVPGRTVTSLSFETIEKLSRHPRIVGIKEASGDISLAKKLSEIKDFVLLSGDDGTYVDFLRAGGTGVISVSSHVMGQDMKTWTDLIKKDPAAKVDSEKWDEFLKLLFIEANPIPLKKALQLMGIIDSAELRLPLVELSESSTVLLKEELAKKGLLA